MNLITQKRVPLFVFTIVGVVIIRLAIYFWLHTNGYFYGIPWDSFSRTIISYNWAHQPFFSLSDGYWLPLQFWLVGSIFFLLKTIIPTSEILVPVILNNLFFIGSLVVVYKFTRRVTHQPLFAFIACLFASVFAGDVFTTYTALSEPLLIFFLLLASYLFYRTVTDKKRNQPRDAVAIAMVIALAAATHYIGWFYAIFFCFYFLFPLFQSLRNRRFSHSVSYATAILLCAIVPLAWLTNNYLWFGNPLHPLMVAKQAQAAYIGQLSPLTRIIVVPKVLIQEFYPVVIPGAIAAAVILFRKWRVLFFVLPVGFVLGFIWLSTALAFSAPYQEPRYLVIFGWALIPLTAIAGHILCQNTVFRKYVAGVLLVLILLLNVQQITAFRNSFGPEVQGTAYYARDWFRNQPPESMIFIQRDSFAEEGVIRVISGYPDRFVLVPNEQFESNEEDLLRAVRESKNDWLLITKNADFAEQASHNGLFVDQKDPYFLIFES